MDIIVDRIQYAWAEKFDGTPLYVLTQLSEATIEISAESKDAVDKDGTLIKRFWQAKTGTFTATNAMINLNMLASNSGITPLVVSDGVINQGTASSEEVAKKMLRMPKVETVQAGQSKQLTEYIAGTMHVAPLYKNGSMGAALSQEDSEALISTSGTQKEITVPAAEGDITRYIIKYDRYVSNGGVVKNSADKFPDTIKLTLKVLCVDPCEADVLKSAYVVMESFQPSPEISIGLTTDTTLDYTGDQLIPVGLLM